jgi:hypothetical protein
MVAHFEGLFVISNDYFTEFDFVAQFMRYRCLKSHIYADNTLACPLCFRKHFLTPRVKRDKVFYIKRNISSKSQMGP